MPIVIAVIFWLAMLIAGIEVLHMMIMEGGNGGAQVCSGAAWWLIVMSWLLGCVLSPLIFYLLVIRK